MIGTGQRMRFQKTVATLALAAFLLTAATPSFAVSKEIIQLQTQVQALTDQIQRLQQSIDERMGVMRSLVEQSTDNVNKLSNSLAAVQKTLQQQNLDTHAKLEQTSGQIQTLNDSVDEIRARLDKISKQLSDMANQQQSMMVQQATTQQPAQQPAQPQAPPPDVLYNNALRDYNAGRYDLAIQQFQQYIQYYANTDLAGNAQFYIADIEYRQGNYDAAVKDYNKVLEQFPSGNKAASAQLRKGYALLELGQRQAGVRELNSLIQRFPRSIEATQARDRLRKLGVTPTRRK